jgi:acetyl-CoA acetyltransferase
MQKVMIGGTGMTRFGRFIDRSLRSLSEEAVALAMLDASMEADSIQAVFYGNAAGGLLTGQECIRGQASLRGSGLLGRPIYNIENACASSSSAFHLAWLAVASGLYETVIAVGAEKMTNRDRTLPIKALEAAADKDELEELKAKIGTSDDATGSIFMDLYKEIGRDYMARSGATATDFAKVAVKSRQFASHNVYAQYREPSSVDEVMASRMVADPLRMMMCSPIGDGAAALVLTSEANSDKLGLPYIEVLASVVVSGEGKVGSDFEPVAQRAARQAYEVAGVGPEDLHVIELHDAAAPAEFLLSEQLGLALPGEGVKLFNSGKTSMGGSTPINPSGGLISRGHPIGATGCAQLVELSDQLRGRSGKRQREGARVTLAENGGGWLGNDAAAAVVTILAS